MKKILSMLVAAAMLCMLAGCTAGGGVSSKTDADTSKSDAGTKDFKVGVIHIGNPGAGAGYTFAHDQGIVAMQKALHLTDAQIIRKNDVVDTDAVKTKTAIEECIEAGAKIIFGTSWGYMDVMEEMAKEYPKVVFSHCSGYKSNGTNFNNYFGRIYQARYLTGIAAGLKTKSNKIGFVAAMGVDNSEVTGGINAFAMGVKSVNPTAKVYVKVTNSWYNPTAETQAAEALLDDGCDVIAQHCDTPNPQTAAQKKDVWGCGYNSDMSKDAPKAHLTAPIWNWGVYYTAATKAAMENTWDGKNYYGGMDDDMVDISPLSANCSEGTKEKIEAAKAKIKDGSFKVFEGEIKDNKGKIVCEKGKVISDADITGNMKWYFETVVEK